MFRLISLIIILSPGAGFCQLVRTSSWVFGQGVGLHFTKDSLVALSRYKGTTQFEGTGVYNDSEGNLAYYVMLGHLYDSTNVQYNFNYELGGGSSASQANIITSLDDTLLHIFGTTSGYNFYYSTFNTNTKTFGVKGKSLQFRASEAEALVNHQNGKWQWVVNHSRLGDTLFSYLITEKGLEMCPVISQAGPFYTDWYPGQGLAKFGPDGRLLVIGAWSLGRVTLCTFNNQTGIIEELFKINLGDTFPYGLEIKDHNLFVGCNRPEDKIYGYDISVLDSHSVAKSRVILFDTSDMDVVGHLQHAINGNIYVAVVNQNRLAYLDCKDNYKFKYTDSLFGTKKCYGGFPNFNASFFHTPSLNFEYWQNCETNNFTFSANDTIGADAWIWQFNKGSQSYNSSGKQINFIFPDTGEWKVRCIAIAGSRKDTVIKEIKILAPLKREFLGEDILLSAGNVSGTIIGPQNMHCTHWQRFGDTVEIKSTNFSFSDTGYYLCRATDKVFCTYLDTIQVRICDSFASAARIYRIGDSLFTNTWASKYQWFRNDTVLSGAIGNKIRLAKTGEYKLRTWNSDACDSMSPAFDVSSLGMKYLKESETIRIIPNPNHGIFVLEATNISISKIEIFNTIGELVWRVDSPGLASVLLQPELAEGVYFLKLNDIFSTRLQLLP